MENNKNQQKKPLNKFIRFSGVGMQMAVIIALGTLGGDKLDKKFEFETPWLTIVCSLLAIGASLYLVIKEVTQSDR